MMPPDSLMNIDAASRKVDVDNRIPLSYYFKAANNLLAQAIVLRQEEKIADLYTVLLRFSSLVSETMPFHLDYGAWCSKEKATLMKKLLEALKELELLKPEVRRQISEINRAQSRTRWCQPDGQRRTPFTTEASSSTASNGTSLRLEMKLPRNSAVPFNAPPSSVPATASSTAKHREMAVRINASLQSAFTGRPPFLRTISSSQAYASSSRSNSSNISCFSNQDCARVTTQNPGPASTPLDLPIENLIIDDDGLFNAPDLSFSSRAGERNEDAEAPSCIICFNAPIEGACVPCGHMAGCMSCLNNIKAKNWNCPVCRVKVDLVIRLYTV